MTVWRGAVLCVCVYEDCMYLIEFSISSFGCFGYFECLFSIETIKTGSFGMTSKKSIFVGIVWKLVSVLFFSDAKPISCQYEIFSLHITKILVTKN